MPGYNAQPPILPPTRPVLMAAAAGPGFFDPSGAVLPRVVPRLRWIVGIGMVVAAAGTLGAVWPFLFGNEFVDLFAGGDATMAWGIAVSAARLVLAGGFPLLGFYALRLWVHAASADREVAEQKVEENLRKIRRILVACMLLALASVAAALTADPSAWRAGYLPSSAFGAGLFSEPSWRGVPAALVYAACCAACGFACAEVRRSLAEYEKPKDNDPGSRGFEVQLPGTPPAEPQPTAAPAAPWAVVATPRADPPAVPGPPPLPVPVAAAAVVPAHAAWQPPAGSAHDVSLLRDTGVDRDLRTVLHAAAVAGIVLYTLLVPSLARQLGTAWEWLSSAPAVWSAPPTPGGSAGQTSPLEQFALAAFRIVAGLCGIFWIVWGVLCVTIGPRAYRLARLTAYATLAAAAAAALLGLSDFSAAVDRAYAGGAYYSYDERFAVQRAATFRLIALDLLHPVVMLVLLTRPRVKDLFARGSEAGETK